MNREQVPAENVLNEFARMLIRHKAKWLISKSEFARQDRDDIEQELTLRLLHGLRRFNPARANCDAFTTTIVERAAITMLRERQTPKHRVNTAFSLDGMKDENCIAADPADHRDNDQKQHDLAIDVAEILNRLPAELRALAERLKTQLREPAARSLGISRWTLRQRVRRLKNFFKEV